MDPLEALSMDAAQATAAACIGCVGGTQCENLSATGVSWAAADDANPIAIAAITPRESIFIFASSRDRSSDEYDPFTAATRLHAPRQARDHGARRNDGQQSDDAKRGFGLRAGA